MKFNDKSVVITGAGSGIGAALARQAAKLGARVCVADLDGEKAQAVADEFGGLSVQCDVRNEASIRKLINTATDEIGEIDVFVSNAGVFRGQPDHAASASDDVWMLNWRVHVMANVYAARLLLPAMTKRKSGHLVTIASAAGLLNQIGDAAYTATKHAAVSFAESLAITHGADGIDVSVVCPQYVATPLLGLSDADVIDTLSLMTADEVAQAIVTGIEAKKFLILSHPAVHDYVVGRAQDHDRWIAGMQLLRNKALKTTGSANADAFYMLI
ncbi:MAG: SDR family oxidoreductase [Sulfitobacter sp.]